MRFLIARIFLTIKSLWEGDWGLNHVFFLFRGSFGAAKFLTHMLGLTLMRIFFSLSNKKLFSEKLLRPFVSVKSDFLKFSLF